MIRKLTYFDNPILRARSDSVSMFGKELESLVEDMKETLYLHKGVGLAAPQIGHNIRLFLSCVDKELDNGDLVFFDEPVVFINPILSNVSDQEVRGYEGCLSIPGLRGEVMRPISVDVEAFDIQGKKFQRSFSGFAARVIFHENDHLDGVLYIDKMIGIQDKKFQNELKKIKEKHATTI